MSENNDIRINGDAIELNRIPCLSIAVMLGYIRDMFTEALQQYIDAYDSSHTGYNSGYRVGYTEAKHEFISLLEDM